MLMPTYYINFLNESLRKQQKISPSCRSLKAQSQQQGFLLVGVDIAFVVANSTIFQYGALIYGYLQMKDLLYTQYGQNIRSFCPPWMGQPQYSDQNTTR